QVNGEQYSNDLRVGPQDVAMHKRGDIVQVQLLPERPDSVDLYDEHYPKVFVTILLSLFGLAAAAGALRVLWVFFITPWRQRALLRWGEVTAGVILERKKADGRSAFLTLTYEYQANGYGDSGRISPADATRATMRIPGYDFRGSRVGDCVTVIYN